MTNNTQPISPAPKPAAPKPGDHEASTNQNAYDEAMRELQVRERCFPGWVRDGRISGSDARDRLNRQARICFILASLADVKVGAEAGDVPW